MNLTEKEKLILKEEKNQEEYFIARHKDYAGQVENPELKKMFNSFAEEQQKHLSQINRIMSGRWSPQANYNEEDDVVDNHLWYDVEGINWYMHATDK